MFRSGCLVLWRSSTRGSDRARQIVHEDRKKAGDASALSGNSRLALFELHNCADRRSLSSEALIDSRGRCVLPGEFCDLSHGMIVAAGA